MFNWMRKKRPAEDAEFNHSCLGKLNWNKKDNEWIGDRKGIIISLGHEDNLVEPSQELLGYATEMLADTKLESILEQEKSKLIREVGELTPQQQSEIQELYFESINFSLYKGDGYIFVVLGPENDERSWRLEVFDNQNSALGFDT